MWNNGSKTVGVVMLLLLAFCAAIIVANVCDNKHKNLINNPEPYPKIKEYIITEDSLGNVEVVGVVFDKPFIPPQTIHSAIRCDDYK